MAGTKGKGSLCALVEAALRGAGLRVGRYASPHVERIEERVSVDGRPVSEVDFDDSLARALLARARLSLVRGYVELGDLQRAQEVLNEVEERTAERRAADCIVGQH